mgnify:CR=1 FL=1
MHDLVIFGAGGVGRQVAQIVYDINSVKATWNLIGYLDDDPAKLGQSVAGLLVLGDYRWLSSQQHIYVAIAIGLPQALFKTYQQLESIQHQNIATLVHPSVWQPQRIMIGKGSVVYAGAMLDPDINIGMGCMINKGCTIGHDTVLGNFTSLAPGVNLGGAVDIGYGCYFGINSATVQGVSVGAWSVIGAGAVVLEDLPANVTAVGTPAKVIKTRKEGWHLL